MLEKKYVEKNKAQISSSFAVAKRAPSPWKKIFSKKKKNLPAYLCRYDLQNVVQKFFLNKWVSRYLFKFGWF